MPPKNSSRTRPAIGSRRVTRSLQRRVTALLERDPVGLPLDPAALDASIPPALRPILNRFDHELEARIREMRAKVNNDTGEIRARGDIELSKMTPLLRSLSMTRFLQEYGGSPGGFMRSLAAERVMAAISMTPRVHIPASVKRKKVVEEAPSPYPKPLRPREVPLESVTMFSPMRPPTPEMPERENDELPQKKRETRVLVIRDQHRSMEGGERPTQLLFRMGEKERVEMDLEADGRELTSLDGERRSALRGKISEIQGRLSYFQGLLR